VEGYWRLGEKVGDMARDERLAHDGSYVGRPLLAGQGAIVGDSDTAVEFAAAINDYVGLGDLSLGEGTAFSAETWMKTTSSNTNRWLVGEGAANTNGPIWGLIHEGARARAYYRTDGGAWANLVGTKKINDGAWHHLAMTVTKGGSISLYVDGAPDRTAPTPAGPITLSTTAAGVLRRAALCCEYAGNLDEVAVYRSALAASTVHEHYSKGTTP